MEAGGLSSEEEGWSKVLAGGPGQPHLPQAAHERAAEEVEEQQAIAQREDHAQARYEKETKHFLTENQLTSSRIICFAQVGSVREERWRSSQTFCRQAAQKRLYVRPVMIVYTKSYKRNIAYTKAASVQ